MGDRRARLMGAVPTDRPDGSGLAWTAPRADRRSVLAAVFVGGAVGTLGRAGLAELLEADPAAWPWRTFVANLVACLVLGWVVAHLARRRHAGPHARPFLATGLCGGLSTFSTLQVELIRMIERDDLTLAAGYGSASVAAGLVAVAIGGALGRTGGRTARPAA